MNNWYKFYEKRINSSYQTYFEYKYFPFLNKVLNQAKKETHVIDAGCAIGSVSKYLKKYNIDVFGFDIDNKMLELAQMNVPETYFINYDILTVKSNSFTITHGVLEHFNNEQIKKILQNFPKSIHYVPLIGYKTPSFGDERLLTKEYWINTFNLRDYQSFNNEKDFLFSINL